MIDKTHGHQQAGDKAKPEVGEKLKAPSRGREGVKESFALAGFTVH